ncbi:MAG: hypothetical protein LIQ31_02785, partial [Planctomycetes bacterium]|nr:hypothetical protein [Planctomycetota bacterium]
MFKQIFSMRGSEWILVRPNSFCIAGSTSFWYFSKRRAFIVSYPFLVPRFARVALSVFGLSRKTSTGRELPAERIGLRASIPT